MERMGELPGRCILLVGEQELQRQRIQEEIALAIRLGNRMHLVQQLELYRELSGVIPAGTTVAQSGRNSTSLVVWRGSC